MSILARSEAELSDDAKTLFDWCKEGNVNKVDAFIDGHDINTRDENVRTLHTRVLLERRGAKCVLAVVVRQ